MAPAPMAASRTPYPKAPPPSGPKAITTRIGTVKLPKITATNVSPIVDRNVRLFKTKRLPSLMSSSSRTVRA